MISKSVRQSIIPGNTNSKWKLVRNVMDVNVSNLPRSLLDNKFEKPQSTLQDKFAEYFDDKVKNVLKEDIINNFLDDQSARKCILNFKVKSSESFDRTTQRILMDGIEVLTKPITT
jgi:hypothetical protein